MKQLVIIAFFCCRLLLNSAEGQSVYLFNYNYGSAADTTTYSCLFFGNKDGTGLLKLKYKQSLTGQDMVRELVIDSFYLADQPLGGSNNNLVIKTRITDNDTSALLPPAFIFRPDDAGDYYEPFSVCTSPDEPVILPGTTFTAKRFVRPDTLSREFAAGYFKKNDPFILRYFTRNDRGGSILLPSEMNTKMHLLLVADTLDKSIGYAGKSDLKLIRETFEQLSQKMGITKNNFNFRLFAGKQFERKPILDAIKLLKPGANDIVIFYYVGHGFRVDTTETFPHIKSTNNNHDSATIVKNSIRMKEEVFDVLKKKNARFNLVVSDCCNSDIEKPRKTGPALPKQRGDDTWELEYKNTRDLFMSKVPVSIMITAAKNGEKAICSRDLNSAYLSFALINTLKEYTAKLKTNVSWKQLLEAAKAGTSRYARMTCCSDPCCDRSCTTGTVVRCTQTAVYTIEFRQ